MQSPGNAEVVAALEQLLAKARAGDPGYLIAVMLTDGKPPAGGWFGTQALEPAALRARDQMAGLMDAAILNKTMPPRASGTPADRVCYNVPASPLSFDFIHWLIDAEMTRRREGAPAPLKVCFWLGRDGKTGLRLPARQQMLDHVLRPALALVGAVEDPSAADGREKASTKLVDVVTAARGGAEVPKLKAALPIWWAEMTAKRFGGAVTITLRQTSQWPHRNSNIAAWAGFARHLRERGEHVVIVNDTATADAPFFDFETCPAASLDLHARAALYASAKMNFLVSNGPASLCIFSDWPYTIFIKTEPDGHAYAPNTPSFWRDQYGIEIGEQFPWVRPNQKIVWEADNYDNLVRSWP